MILKVARPERPIWYLPLRREQSKARRQVKELKYRFHGDWCDGACWLDRLGVPAFVWWTDNVQAASALIEYADDDAKDAIEGVTNAESASRASDADVDVPCPAGTSYLPYQRAGIAWIISRFDADQRRVLLGDSMGLGKTIQALGAINASSDIGSVLVIVPASLRINWKRECAKWLVRRSTVVVANSAKDIPSTWQGDLVVITNYERLITTSSAEASTVAACRNAAKKLKSGRLQIQGKAWAALCEQPLPQDLKVSGKTRKTLSGPDTVIDTIVKRLESYGHGTSLFDTLMSRTWDLLILDESHRVKNSRAQQTEAVLGSFPAKKSIPRSLGLVDVSDRVLFMTGTPVTNRIKDLWTTIRTIAPNTIGKSFFAFAKRYCDAVHNGYGWDFNGASNLAELQHRLRTEAGGCMVRRVKEEVLKELPDKRRSVIALDAKDGIVKELDLTARAYEEELAALEVEKLMAKAQRDIEAYDRAVKRMSAIQKAMFEELAAERIRLGKAKAPIASEWIIDQLEGGLHKVVVFAHHKAVIETLMTRLGAYNPVQLTGDTPMDQRQKAVDEFQSNPNVRVFVGNMQAAGVGITLTAASDVVFVELDWTPANILQSEDRCHRIGQKDCVNVYHLVFDQSLDQRMAELLVKKMDDADSALDRRTEKDVSNVELNTECDGSKRNNEVQGTYVSMYVPAQVSRARQHTSMSFTPDQVSAIHEGIRWLAGRCDGARAHDMAGFSKPWVKCGHWLAALPELGQAEAQAAYTACVIFQRQLPNELKDKLPIPETVTQ